ncbi:MAG: tetratricopeptide repeat protein [Pirellulaceae bacterium]|nr:tetratricopeptide repeat protein [Pirellulaceae bacterium]
MKIPHFVVALLLAVPAVAQEPADPIGQQAASLEAELGKYKDTSPEAADAMVKLVDLYHQDGRLFGLVRIAQQFVAAHPQDKRHPAVMLKLIDGQEALSRNKELSATIRQFLARYPAAAECGPLEIRLADSLIQLADRPRAAEACRAVWTRQPTTESGRRYGAQAVSLFSGLNNADGYKQAAELGEQMLDKLPPGEFAKEVGHQAFHDYRRLSQWAKSSAVGAKLLQKNLGGDAEGQRALHITLAENHANLGQQANAAASLKAARALRDDQWVHYQLIHRLASASAKPAELEPVVMEYGQKYPQRADRFHGLSYLASSLNANGDKPRALQIWAQLLPHDPVFGGNASAFVRENGSEPAQLADSEAKLKAAIAQNKPGVYYLRYVLAIDLYRDRLKDNAKAKGAIRELITQSPTDDGHTSGPLEWLLYSSADDNEFKSDLTLALESRKKYPHLGTFYNMVRGWWQNARQNKEFAARAKLASEELTKSNADPLLVAFADLRAANAAQAEGIRNQMLLPASFDKFSDATARSVLQAQADYYRHYGPVAKRGENVRIYAQFCRRFPQDYAVAWGWLEAATDYGNPEDCKAAAEHFLKFQPENAWADVWRRLLICADKNNDPNLVKAAWNFMQTAQQKFGNDPTYAASLGDVLLKHKLETEAVAHWTKYLTANRQHYESRECAARLLARLKEPAQRIPFLQDLEKADTDMHGRYAQWLADEYLKTNDLANFERVLKQCRTRQNERPLRSADFDIWPINGWVDSTRASMTLKDDEKTRILTAIRDLQVYPAAAGAALALLENVPADPQQKMSRLLELQKLTRLVGNEWYDWDRLLPFAQSAVGKKDFVPAAVVATGMLANIPNVDEPRKKVVRDLVTQSLSRMGGVGLTIDDSSPLAPLMQAALFFRLGDERLAFDSYLANKKLFDDNRNQLPPDLLMFVCERLIAAGGDTNHDYVEEVLRGWLVQHSESKTYDDASKARMQLLLARNFFKAQRYDVARSEFTTVVNRYPATPQATEAEFGIGETFLSQKVYDQAEQVFEKLARSAEIDVVVRAEFLRGVLAFRRGDRDEARDIFKSVLERVPNVELANQALYNLAEVYGSEERYIDQLNLLRTVGRLGRSSKRRHTPGLPLSIVVHDSDLGISRGHNRIPVRVTTEPGGDSELIYLVGSGAGKGLFRADVETRLGQAVADDHVLQLTGNDTIKCDYPEQFKAEFKTVPLSDVEIRVAADAKFEVASSKILDLQQETFSAALQRESEEENGDKRVSQGRPANQIKPGNLVYLRVKDGDRDLTNDADKVVVKLTAESGDQIQVPLVETGPHTGIFEASAQTGELPAGALASDTAIDHSPLMAIDRDAKTAWMSEPDGATPKTLTIDMKALNPVSRVKFQTPDGKKYAPVRGDLLASQDGEFWFRVASQPPRPEAAKLGPEFSQMTRRVYNGNHTDYTTWEQVVALSKIGKGVEEVPAETLVWQRPADSEDATKAYTVLWQGKFIQPKSGAVRIGIKGGKTALYIDGQVELPVGPNNRTVDLWLEAGPHDLAIFAASSQGQQPVEATLARADLTSAQVELLPFRAADFDLASPAAQKVAAPAAAPPANIPLVVGSAAISKKSEKFGLAKVGEIETINNWQAPEDSLAWEVNGQTPGVYEVWLDLAHEGDGGRYQLDVAGRSLEGRVPNTGNWATYRETRLGLVLLPVGKQTLSIKPLEIVGGGLMNLKGISLRPVTGPSVLAWPNEWEFRFASHELRYVRLVTTEYLGEALAISNVEIAGAGATAAEKLYIPTQEDVLSLAANATLEIAAGDQITATYTDETTLNDQAGSQLLEGKLQATYFNARVEPISYDFVRTPGGGVQNLRKQLKRIDASERIIVEVTDYDEDRTADRDTIKFEVSVNDGAPVEFVATETEENTGIFTKEVDTAAPPEAPAKPAATTAKGAEGAAKPGPAADPKDKLVVKPGDRITIRYFDAHNTFPGHSVPREDVIYVAQPTVGLVRVRETRVIPPPKESKAPPQIVVLPPKKEQAISGIAFEAPITVEVIDPDAAKDSRSTTLVTLTTTDGATVQVECAVSAQFSDIGGDAAERQALEEGRFVGQVILQLGGKSSPAVVPLTTDMPRNLIGKVRLGDEAGVDNTGANLVTRVLSLTGKDVVTAVYSDERRPDGKPAPLSAQGRLISNGQLAVTDRDYDKDVTQLHVGERLYLRVVDPDLDSSDARDAATVEIMTELGDKETVKLEETLTHSGIFTGSLQLKAVDKPMPGNLDPAEPAVESYFGDNVSVRYVDPAASTESGTLELSVALPVVVGTDGLVAAFSKTFNDENLAVETKFRIAESFFELFKSHKTLQRDDEKKTDLEAGRRVLREVIEDYPDPKYAPRIAYLLGQFAQELEQWDEAIRSYDMILRQYPDHTLAPDAQYKLAQCYEEAGDFDEALEAYVTLAATHPKSPLIPSVMIRISDYFYKHEKYEVAAQVGEKFLERFESHQHAPRMAFRVGQCYFKAKQYVVAGKSFDKFSEIFPKDALTADAAFWSGEAYRMAGNNRQAFISYNNCRWKHPDSEAAKYARGRLALPEMLQQFEAEANSVDNDN